MYLIIEFITAVYLVNFIQAPQISCRGDVLLIFKELHLFVDFLAFAAILVYFCY